MRTKKILTRIPSTIILQYHAILHEVHCYEVPAGGQFRDSWSCVPIVDDMDIGLLKAVKFIESVLV